MNITSYEDDYQKAEKLLESTKGFMGRFNLKLKLADNASPRVQAMAWMICSTGRDKIDIGRKKLMDRIEDNLIGNKGFRCMSEYIFHTFGFFNLNERFIDYKDLGLSRSDEPLVSILTAFNHSYMYYDLKTSHTQIKDSGIYCIGMDNTLSVGDTDESVKYRVHGGIVFRSVHTYANQRVTVEARDLNMFIRFNDLMEMKDISLSVLTKDDYLRAAKMERYNFINRYNSKEKELVPLRIEELLQHVYGDKLIKYIGLFSDIMDIEEICRILDNNFSENVPSVELPTIEFEAS